MIEVKGAKKYYNRHKRNQVTAIDNTTLSFGDSGLVAILGNSGCGKTTLLNMIGGLDKPDRGKIYVNGKKMNGLFAGHTDNIRNKNIGYIFQNYHLIDDMTVFDNVALVLKMQGVRNKNKLKQSVGYALDQVGLYRYRNRPASALSGGERQRVGIARAIVKNPGIIIADEPTGNLDSGNSLEVMNIIKTISKDKLVILVTHERQLAQFYADRIIEIVDGKVVSDAPNIHDDDLDYRIDNKIYLQDFENQSPVSAEGINLSYYSDGSSDVDVKLVLRNGNLYIQCDQRKIEVVDQDSAIEFIDDHYHKLSLEEAQNKSLDFSKLGSGKSKIRYHSVYNIFNLFTSGVRKVFSYKLIKKILLLGFVAAAMFIMYSVSSVLGVRTVTDDMFVRVYRDYLYVDTRQNTADEFIAVEKLPGVRYVLPGTSETAFTVSYADLYYQTADASDTIYGSMAGTSQITAKDIVAGRMPENDHEIVVDKLTLKNVLNSGSAPMVGFNTPEAFLGKECRLGNTYNYYNDYGKYGYAVEDVIRDGGNEDANSNVFTIVGICDQLQPCIFVDDTMLFKICMWSDGINAYDAENSAAIMPIEDVQDRIKLKKGRLPENDYEVIVDYNYRTEYKIGKTIPGKINGHKLTVVGYYTSDYQLEFISNFNTYKYKYLNGTSCMTILADDKDSVMEYFKAQNKNITDTYADAKFYFEEDRKDTVKETMIIAGIVLAISLVEIFLMLRSSFLSRVKEVGTLRAIGLKKSDVYKMFLGEILAITTLTAPIAFIIMGYALKTLVKVEYFSLQYAFDLRVVLISAAIVYIFNILIGLLPVMTTLIKTPASILARTDVD